MFDYENIGAKIKGLAKAAFIVEAIAAIICGIGIIIDAISTEIKYMILSGLLIIFLGPIIAWVSSWLLYGFGQLIENSDILTENSDIVAESNHFIATTCEQKAKD